MHIIMANKTKNNTSRRRKKLTVEERRALYATIPAGNKYMKAAEQNQGNFIVYDPAFM